MTKAEPMPDGPTNNDAQQVMEELEAEACLGYSMAAIRGLLLAAFAKGRTCAACAWIMSAAADRGPVWAGSRAGRHGR